MREKVLEYMKITGVDLDGAIDGYIKDFRSQFKSGFGDELPEDATRAAALIETTLRSRKNALVDQIAEIYESKFTEADLDAILDWHRSDAAKKNAEVSSEIAKRTVDTEHDWFTAGLRSIEKELGEILGTAQAAAPPDAPAPEAPPPPAA